MKSLMKEVSNHELAQNAEKSVEEFDKSIVWNIMLGLKLNQKSNSRSNQRRKHPDHPYQECGHLLLRSVSMISRRKILLSLLFQSSLQELLLHPSF